MRVVAACCLAAWVLTFAACGAAPPSGPSLGSSRDVAPGSPAGSSAESPKNGASEDSTSGKLLPSVSPVAFTQAVGAEALAQAAVGQAAAVRQGTAREGAAPGQIRVTRCLISAIQDVSVPAQEAGVLSAVHAREGQTVARDQETPLAQIDDRDPQIRKRAAEIEVQIAKVQAESDVKVRIAEKTAAVAKAEYEKSLEINKRSPGAVPETEVRRQYLTYERQLLEAEFARMELDVAAKTQNAKVEAVQAAANDIRKRRIETPVSGVVDKVYKREGEWVTPGEQVFRVVQVDRVRVEGFLNFSEVSPIEVAGQPAIVEITFKRRGKEPYVKQLTGVVEFVSPVVEAGEYRVWTEVDNVRLPDGQWLLHPGTYADMQISVRSPGNQAP